MSLTDNLFEPLLPQVETMFREADGHELGSPGRIGKAQALHSSSCLVMNCFHHWYRIGRLDLVAHALGVPSDGIVDGAFERKFMIDGRFGTSPNLDFALLYNGEGPKVTAIECKFTEPFGRDHSGFPPKYLAVRHLWDGLPRTKHLANQITGAWDPTFRLVHAKQLICHVLALHQTCDSMRGFWLHYLYFDTGDGLHKDELEYFASFLHADGVAFTWSTYQDLITQLCRDHWHVASDWCDYMSSRYI